MQTLFFASAHCDDNNRYTGRLVEAVLAVVTFGLVWLGFASRLIWYGSPQPSDFTGVDITRAESDRAPGSHQGAWQHRKAGLGGIGGVLGLVSGSGLGAPSISHWRGLEPDCRAPT